VSSTVPAPIASPTPEQDELRARLKAKEASLFSRFEALQSEARVLPFVGGGGGEKGPVARFVKENPLVLALGTVALTALASFVLGMRKKRKHRPIPDDPELLVNAYLRTILDEASARVARGRSPEEALDHAFRKRPPLILYGNTAVSTPKQTKRSLVREGARAVGNQAFRVGLSYALGRWQGETHH
jgi:hypothetical protein